MTDQPQPQQQPQAEGVNLDLDRLIARYGRMLGQSALEAEVAQQEAIKHATRAEQAEAQVRELGARIAHLEDAMADAEGGDS